MENDRLLKELEELIKIDLMKRIIEHKVEELKYMVNDDLDHYLRLYKNSSKKSKDKKAVKRVPVGKVDFELVGMGGVWFPNIPGEDINGFDVIPEPVLEYIVHSPENTVMRYNLTFEELPERRFDLSFTKREDGHITGTIEEKIEGDDAPAEKISTKSIHKGKSSEPKELEKIENIKVMIKHMVEYEEFFHHVFKEFRLWWQPQPLIKRPTIS